jgi:hypothetical protein
VTPLVLYSRSVLLLVLCLSTAPGAHQTASTAAAKDAASFLRKVDQIKANETPKRKGAVRTTIAEHELNGWLTVHAPEYLPAGVLNPTVTLEGQGRLSGRATVDLDAVKKQRQSGGLLDPWRLIGGQLPVTAAGILHTKDGVARIELLSATVSGVPVPKALLQEIVSYYSRTPEDPDGIGLDDSFPMAVGIREVAVDVRQATVVQ